MQREFLFSVTTNLRFVPCAPVPPMIRSIGRSAIKSMTRGGCDGPIYTRESYAVTRGFRTIVDRSWINVNTPENISNHSAAAVDPIPEAISNQIRATWHVNQAFGLRRRDTLLANIFCLFIIQFLLARRYSWLILAIITAHRSVFGPIARYNTPGLAKIDYLDKNSSSDPSMNLVRLSSIHLNKGTHLFYLSMDI